MSSNKSFELNFFGRQEAKLECVTNLVVRLNHQKMALINQVCVCGEQRVTSVFSASPRGVLGNGKKEVSLR